MKIQHTIHRAALMLWGSLCTLASFATALELSDIHLPMTRDEADASLSKDYSYSVMTDGSVRRTWEQDDKSVVIDFDTVSNETIMVAIIYKRPVAKKKGIEDAHTIAAGKFDEKATWDAPKDKEAKELIANTYGLKNARRKKLDDKAMLFYEMNDQKSRIVRVSLFARMPQTNRWALTTLTKNSHKTALGNQMGGSFINELYKDEELRKNTIPTQTAKDTTSEETDNQAVVPTITITHKSVNKPTPASDTAAEKPEVKTFTPPVSRVTKPKQPTVATTTSTTTTTETTGRTAAPAPGGQTTMTLLPDAPDWLKAVGIEEPTWWHYVGLALVLLLLMIFGIRAVSQSSSRAKQRQRYVNVVAQKPTSSAAKIKKN